jgi:tryptophan synthase beta chain
VFEISSDSRGRYGPYGGQYVPETVMPCLRELEDAYAEALDDPTFKAELDDLLTHYVGRSTPLYFAEKLTAELGGQHKVYLKREDLNHTGAHKINNCIGQVLLAVRMGKNRIVAETGAGQHGVATATVCARFGIDCTVYMGAEDIRRQHPNVERMGLLGAEVRAVTSGTQTLKDATSEAIRDWVAHVGNTHYIIGSTVGPHPYPQIVRDFQAVIGDEARAQILKREGRLPTDVVACIGGGSNAMGIFNAFLGDGDVCLHGVEAGGSSEGHSLALGLGTPGVLHGAYSYLLQDDDGQVLPAHSISAGLDYPGVGPEHSHLKDLERVRYGRIDDHEALAAFDDLCRLEGIIPALESSHALAYLRPLIASGECGDLVIVNLSGRGDKDLQTVLEVRS